MPEQLLPADRVVLRDLGAVASVRASAPGVLLGISIVNNQAAAIFVQVFDIATAGGVTLGTTVPDYEFSVALSSSAVIALPAGGIKFRSGIQVASTTTEKGATPSAAGVQTFWLVN